MPLLFYPTFGCNLACLYCFQRPQLKRPFKPNEKIDLEKIEKSLDEILSSYKSYYGQAVDEVVFHGGEPTSIPIDELEKLFSFFKNRGLKISMQSNCYMITEEHIKLFKKYNVRVGGSIDGFPDINLLRGFFDENGKSVKSGFLKAPLSYRRITSFFTQSRFHPIYKVFRPHYGIDYAAPIGTPVSSIGDGIVIFCGWVNNGYGKCIKIKHPNGYVSYYGHLNGFAKGIRNGVKVKKGEIIGYVGMTGAATGPHLDFRIKKDGKFINFLKLKFVPEKNVPRQYMDEFEKIKEEYKKILDEEIERS